MLDQKCWHRSLSQNYNSKTEILMVLLSLPHLIIWLSQKTIPYRSLELYLHPLLPIFLSTSVQQIHRFFQNLYSINIFFLLSVVVQTFSQRTMTSHCFITSTSWSLFSLTAENLQNVEVLIMTFPWSSSWKPIAYKPSLQLVPDFQKATSADQICRYLPQDWLSSY